jgi:flavin-binding protein dodecin
VSENTTFKKVELVGTSSESLSDAVVKAIEKASETIRDMKWFEVVEQRGRITDNKVDQFQVTIRVGFQVE